MMENPGTDNLIKAHFQIGYALNGKLVDLEIVQVVFSLEVFRVTDTRRAKVDAGHPRRRPAQGMLGRLRRPAAGNEDGSILPITAARPKQMIVCAASCPVLPQPAISLEAIDRPGIGILVVKVPDSFHHTR
jgi:hypothetical protein